VIEMHSPVFEKLGGESIAGFRFPGRDIDLGAILDISARDHLANAAAAAGH
jgi:hypothetical protein